MRAAGFADFAMALGTKHGSVGTQLRILLDACIVRIDVTLHARHSTFEKTLALPQPDSVVRKTARTSIGPVSRIFIDRLIVFDDRNEVIVVIVARVKSGDEDVSEGMALATDFRVAFRVELGLHNDVVCRSGSPRRFRRVIGHMLRPGVRGTARSSRRNRAMRSCIQVYPDRSSYSSWLTWHEKQPLFHSCTSTSPLSSGSPISKL